MSNKTLTEAISEIISENPGDTGRLITALEKKYKEKFKKETEDLSMVYAKLSGVFMSFLETSLNRLEQVSPEEYKDLVNNILK